ncbi:MAG: hypothetical protein FWD76_02215 [Firmicutes bacterium]|nr:hypothetical protein [Bacillota bacterium]
MKILGKIFVYIIGSIMSVSMIALIAGEFVLQKYAGVGWTQVFGMWNDLTHTTHRDAAYTEEDRQALYAELDQSLYLKTGTINEQVVDTLIEKFYSAKTEQQEQARDADAVVNYLFDEILTTQNMNEEALSRFDYRHDTVYKARLSDKSFAALLDSMIARLASNKLGDNQDLKPLVDSVHIVDLRIDKASYRLPNADGVVQDTMVTRAYMQIGLQGKAVKDQIVAKLGLSGIAKSALLIALDSFIPNDIYAEALVGLDHEIPVQLGLDDLRLGEQYEQLKTVIAKLTSSAGKKIDLDEIVSTPINKVVVPVIQDTKKYIDLTQFENHSLEIDLLGTMLSIAKINEGVDPANQMTSEQVVLALKGLHDRSLAQGAQGFANWYYQKEQDGSYSLDDVGNPIEYQYGEASALQEYKTAFVVDNAFEYRLTLQDKIDPTQEYAFVGYATGADGNRVDVTNGGNPIWDTTQVDETQTKQTIQNLPLDFDQAFEQMMAFFAQKESGGEYFKSQFETAPILARFSDFVGEMGSSTPEEAITKVMEALTLRVYSSTMFAVVSDQMDNIVNTPEMQNLQIVLQSVAIKKIGKHTTLLLGMSITLQPAESGNSSFANQLTKDVQLSVEIDITAGIAPKDKLPDFIGFNGLDTEESKTLLDVFKGRGTGVSGDVFAPLSKNFADIFGKVGTSSPTGKRLNFALIAQTI